MKHILSFCAFVMSLGLFAAHHEELENNKINHGTLLSNSKIT